jgi:arylsulfatase A-like enzyme
MTTLRNRTVAPALACALVLGGVARADDEKPPARPNVLLVSIDTLRADHLSFMGYGRKTSPHLDALAARSVVFEDAHSSSSWTPPGAASFLTGLHPIRHGMVGGPVRIHEEARTLAEMLSGAGYRTRAVVQNAWFAEDFGWARGFEAYQSHDFIGNPLCTPTSELDVAVWLRAKSEKPFFLWLNYFAPHCPYEPHEPWTSSYSPPKYSKWFEAIEFVEMERFKRRILLPRDLERFLALYDGEINFVDQHVGRLLKTLDAAGLRENTVVVLVSDHGEEFKDHGALGHYRTLHTELTHVPFVISLPG